VKERNRFGVLDVAVMILLEQILGYENVEWIHPTQDRDKWRGSCEHGNEPAGSTKTGRYLSRKAAINFSRRNLLHEVS
jgi:hypothetical protein